MAIDDFKGTRPPFSAGSVLDRPTGRMGRARKPDWRPAEARLSPRMANSSPIPNGPSHRDLQVRRRAHGHVALDQGARVSHSPPRTSPIRGFNSAPIDRRIPQPPLFDLASKQIGIDAHIRAGEAISSAACLVRHHLAPDALPEHQQAFVFRAFEVHVAPASPAHQGLNRRGRRRKFRSVHKHRAADFRRLRMSALSLWTPGALHQNRHPAAPSRPTRHAGWG